MKRTTALFALATVGLFASTQLPASPAFAEEGAKKPERYTGGDWPAALVDRPLILGPYMVELRGDTFRIDMSSGRVGDPVSMAPDLFFGLNKRVTIGVVHGLGICVSGDGCSGSYNDVGIEAISSILYGGALELAGRAGVVFDPLDPLTSGLYMGIRARLGGGVFALRLDPNVYIGLYNRDAKSEYLDVPVQLQFQVTAQNAAFLSTGVRGPMRSTEPALEVPIGLGGLFALGSRLDVGAEFVFPNLLGNGGNISNRLMLMRLAIRI